MLSRDSISIHPSKHIELYPDKGFIIFWAIASWFFVYIAYCSADDYLPAALHLELTAIPALLILSGCIMGAAILNLAVFNKSGLLYLDNDGLTYYSMLGKKHYVPWSQIDEFYLADDHFKRPDWTALFLIRRQGRGNPFPSTIFFKHHGQRKSLFNRMLTPYTYTDFSPIELVGMLNLRKSGYYH